MRKWLLVCLWSFAAAAGAADAPSPSGVDSLRRFYENVNSLSAQFSQTVRDESGNTVQESSGSLWIARPNRFRWNYDKPFKQEIVADGSKLWMYDHDLEQVTVRPLAGTLASTPALLLAGRGSLDRSFTLKPLEVRDGLEWVRLVPKNGDNGYDDIRIGFAGGVVRTLEMTDGFGNTTRIVLRGVKENPGIDAQRFTFTPPAGVDVVGE